MADSASNAKIAGELRRIEEDCIHSGKAHYNAGTRWGRYHYGLGVPSVILTALASAAFLKEYQGIAAGLSVVATVLTSLITFLKPSERSSLHKAAGDQYLSLRNDSRIFRDVKLEAVCDLRTALDGLDEFAKRRNDLNAASPAFNRGDFELARRGIEQGEAIHQVDKEG